MLLQALGVGFLRHFAMAWEPAGEKRPLLLAWVSQVSWICLVLLSLEEVAVFRYHSAALQLGSKALAPVRAQEEGQEEVGQSRR